MTVQIHIDTTASPGSGDGSRANPYYSWDEASVAEAVNPALEPYEVIYLNDSVEDPNAPGTISNDWGLSQANDLTFLSDTGNQVPVRNTIPDKHLFNMQNLGQAWVTVKGFHLIQDQASGVQRGVRTAGAGVDNTTSHFLFDNVTLENRGTATREGFYCDRGMHCVINSAAMGWDRGLRCIRNAPDAQVVWNQVVSVANSSRGFEAGSTQAAEANNCYAGGNGNQAFRNVPTLNNCASDDGTGTITGVAYSTTAGAFFVNITPGSEDFHTQTGSLLREAGMDLSTHPIAPVTVDAEGTPRTVPYDIGMYEFVAGGVTIDPNDLTQAQALDGAVFNQKHVFTPNALEQLQILDVATVAQRHIYNPDALVQAQTLDEVTVVVGVIVQPDAIVQAQDLDAAGLVQTHVFTPAALEQAQILDNVVISIAVPIQPDDVTQTQTLESPSVVQRHIFTPDAIEQSQDVEQALVMIEGFVQPHDLTQVQTLDTPVLGVALTPNDIEQAQTLDEAGLSYSVVVIADDLTQAQALENVDYTQHHFVIVDDIEQIQSLSIAGIVTGKLYIHPDRLVFVEREERFVLVLKEERTIQ